jgi:CheY-like chemotaxis protein
MNPPTVLIVDDELHMVRLLALSLKPLQLNLRSAQSGREALHLIRNEPIDLALFDLHMQDIDGLTAVREIRAHGPRPQLPIILLTGAGESYLEAQGRALGVQAFFRKPFSPAELAACVRSLLAPV